MPMRPSCRRMAMLSGRATWSWLSGCLRTASPGAEAAAWRGVGLAAGGEVRDVEDLGAVVAEGAVRMQMVEQAGDGGSVPAIARVPNNRAPAGLARLQTLDSLYRRMRW